MPTKITKKISSNKRQIEVNAEWGGLLDFGWPQEYTLNQGFVDRLKKALDSGIKSFCIDSQGRLHAPCYVPEEIDIKSVIDLCEEAKIS